MPCQMTSLIPSWDWDPSHRVTVSHWGAYGSCHPISISGLPSHSGSADTITSTVVSVPVLVQHLRPRISGDSCHHAPPRTSLSRLSALPRHSPLVHTHTEYALDSLAVDIFHSSAIPQHRTCLSPNHTVAQ